MSYIECEKCKRIAMGMLADKMADELKEGTRR